MVRPTKFHQQLFKARQEQERHNLELNPAFPHTHYPPEYRQFQKRRLNIRGLSDLVLDLEKPIEFYLLPPKKFRRLMQK
ncbi:MAG: hypothetical protein COT55_02080 [Candidatus Diapherotrites archaeon CG09_land_8_20_14_0_10_32_12]|nr:MAG: hypothetical protein COT55_02080 [Candidatus Diapherotrites archaeon CG09_land_8_20_14_0_10_32_12]